VAVLSVDLAHRRWSDLGIVVLDRARPADSARLTPSGPEVLSQPAQGPADPLPEPPIECEILAWDGLDLDPEHEISAEVAAKARRVDPNILAGRLNHLCNVRCIHVIVLDGPQAWKSRHNGLLYARASERQLNTAAKTGLPGLVKPVSMRAHAEFCLDVYEALSRRGWKRLDTTGNPGTKSGFGPESGLDRVIVEGNPNAAWKSLGIKPLPSKRNSKLIDLAECYGALRALIPIACNRPPNHDQLQAIVSGLPGLALEEHNTAGARIVGTAPRREEGHWREGYIVLPVAPARGGGIRWLQ
jgi:hypothetical protein